MKNRGIKFYFTLFFCLSSIQFFGAAISSLSLVYYIYDGIFIITVLMVIVNYKKSYYKSFSIPVLLILIAELIAAFNATYSWGQDLVDSFKAILPYMAYLLFFLLIIWKFRDKEIEKIIVILGSAYIIVYLGSFLIYPTILFGNMGHGDDRGFQRIIINGFGFLFLFSFFSLSKYIINRKFLWLLIYLLSMVCIIMTLTRTLIFFSILFSAVFILRKSSNFTKIMAVLAGALCFYIIIQMNFYKLLVAETHSELSDVKDNIRVQAIDYYLNDFSPNLFSKIVGNGQPYSNKNSSYTKFVDYLEDGRGLYTSDIGYIGLYVKFGILAIFSYLIFIYKTLKTSVSIENLYCKYFLIFIFAISFIIDAPFDTSFIPAIVLATYVLYSKDLSRTDNNESSNKFLLG